MKNIILASSLMMLGFASSAGAAGAAGAEKEASLKKIQQACEKNIRTPKILKDRIDVCKCVVRNHDAHTSLESLAMIEELYLKKSPPPPKESDVVTEEQSQRETLFKFDSEIAEECLKDSKYFLKK